MPNILRVFREPQITKSCVHWRNEANNFHIWYKVGFPQLYRLCAIGLWLLKMSLIQPPSTWNNYNKRLWTRFSKIYCLPVANFLVNWSCQFLCNRSFLQDRQITIFCYNRVLLYMHEQNIICSKMHGSLLVDSYSKVTWWALGQWKDRKNVSIEWKSWLAGAPSFLCFSVKLTGTKMRGSGKEHFFSKLRKK